MRKISGIQIFTFLSILSLVLFGAVFSTQVTVDQYSLGDFRSLVLFFTCSAFFVLYSLLAFRLFLKFYPLNEGNIPLHSPQEFIYHVYILFFLLIFYPIMRNGSLPVPLARLLYLGLGARLGDNSYASGLILDPPFVEMGSNCLIGQNALIVPHAIENENLGHFRIKLGNNITIGANSVVMAGVTIGNDALVAVNSVVTKGTVIGEGEIWGGTPARKIGMKRSSAPTKSEPFQQSFIDPL